MNFFTKLLGCKKEKKGSRIGSAMSSTINWLSLKNDYLYEFEGSVSAFLRKKNIKPSGYISRKVKGWKKERDTYLKEVESITRVKLLEQTVETETQVRMRQAKAARELQEKGIKSLKGFEPETINEARRMIVDGLREEREALGMNLTKHTAKTNGGSSVAVMGTRYGEMLRSLNNKELIKLLEGMERL